MIKAQELRIGNWVDNGPERIYQQVNSDLLYEIEHSKNGAQWEYDYVPITPEILEKCGFRSNIAKGFRLQVNKILYLIL